MATPGGLGGAKNYGAGIVSAMSFRVKSELDYHGGASVGHCCSANGSVSLQLPAHALVDHQT